MPKVKWKPNPEAHDFPAAEEFLTLVVDPGLAGSVVARLRAAETVTFKAKDVLRASGLPHLPASNEHVRKDLAKIADGEALSPVLLVRGDAVSGVALVIADGYHRVCAAYATDENVEVPARIVGFAVSHHDGATVTRMPLRRVL